MRVNRRTGALQLSGGNAQLAPAKQEKKNIIKGALRGLAALGVGLALFAGAVAPQVAWAETQEGTIAAEQGLVTKAANDWQIVSGGYRGNADDNKTAWPKDAAPENRYVRIQKNVVPTDTENEFKIYLSIDKKEDMNEFFDGAILGVDNNMEGEEVGGRGTINGQWANFGNSKSDYAYAPYYLSIDVYDGENYIYTWNGVKYAPKLPGGIKSVYLAPIGAEKGSTCLQIGKQVSGGDSADNPFRLKVDVSWDAFDDVFGTIDNQAISLGGVTDPLGDCIQFVSIDASDGNASYSKDANGISWSPREKSERVTKNGWYLNVAELVYTVRLDVADSAFNSGGLLTDYSNESLDSKYRFATNKDATLDYTVTKVHIGADGSSTTPNDDIAHFSNPEVRGLLYDLVAKKVNEGGKPLAGAEFGLYESDTVNDPNAQPIKTTESDSNGMVKFTGLEWGTYAVKEIAAPTTSLFPYVPSNDVWTETLCYTTNPEGLVKSTVCDKTDGDRDAMKQRSNSFVNVQAWNVPLRIVKNFVGGDWKDTDSFTFSIVADPDSPKLVNSEGQEVDSVTLSKDDASYSDIFQMWRAFANLQLSGVGTGLKCGESKTYGYTITENAGTSEGVVYSKAKWYVTFLIKLNNDGTVSARQGRLDQLADDNGASSTKSSPEVRGAIRDIEFTNRYVSLELSGALKETKTVIGHEAAARKFTFTVAAKDHGTQEQDDFTSAEDAAALAGFQGNSLEENNNLIKIEADTNKGTGEIRTANTLHLTAANAGKTYEYWYTEENPTDTNWHQVDENGNPAKLTYKVEVAVKWSDDHAGLEATVTLYKSTDGGHTWGEQPIGTKIYRSDQQSSEDSGNPLTVAFTNAYGSTLQIKKTNENDEPLPGAEFTVTCDNPHYGQNYATGNDGIATFNNLPVGTYIIEETRVPAGYQKLDGMQLDINANGTADLIWKDTGKPVGENTNITAENGVFTIKVKNYANPNLPSSGSSGAVVLGGVGIAAILTAGAWLVRRKGIA